jgi:hypothetical protein
MDRTVSPVRTGAGDAERDSNGDGEDSSELGSRWSWPADVGTPSSYPTRAPSTDGAMLRGKFWVDASEREEVDEGEATEEERGSGESGSPRRPLERPTLEGFISRAAKLGGSLRLLRRSAFAPGGRGSRFGA